MNDKIIKNWLELAEYDLETAHHMLNTGRYLYVAFTCQQTIEKILKAIYVKEYGKTPPYTHNLVRLVKSLSVKSQISEEDNKFIKFLNKYY